MNSEKYIQELNEILDSREPHVIKMYPKIRDIFRNGYEWPEMDTLRYEISLCLIFGLYQAAITLTNHMLESLLKFSLSYKYVFDKYPEKESKTDRSIASLIKELKPGFEKYDDKTLYFTIEEAFKVGIINKERKTQLHSYRQLLRNAYSHAEKKKIHRDVKIPVQSLFMDEDGRFQVDPETEHKINDLPFIHGIAQVKHAEVNAPPYFINVDSLTREINSMIFKKSE